MGDDSTPDRPDDCICFANAELPCWPCYKVGFIEPNPDAAAVLRDERDDEEVEE